MSAGSSSIASIYRANPRGWAIVMFIFLALGMVFSARSALGLIMPTWEQDLGWDRTFLSSGGSMVLVFMTLISPLAGQRRNQRHEDEDHGAAARQKGAVPAEILLPGRHDQPQRGTGGKHHP